MSRHLFLHEYAVKKDHLVMFDWIYVLKKQYSKFEDCQFIKLETWNKTVTCCLW